MASGSMELSLSNPRGLGLFCVVQPMRYSALHVVQPMQCGALHEAVTCPHLYSEVLWVSFSRLMSLKARNSFGLRAPAAGLAASAWIEWAGGGITCGRSGERYMMNTARRDHRHLSGCTHLRGAQQLRGGGGETIG